MDDDSAMAASELGARIDSMRAALPRLDARELLRRVHSIKGIAQAYGLGAVASLAHAFEGQLAAHGRAAPIRSYLDCMADALTVGPDDQPRCAELLLASVGVRLSAA